MNRGGKSGRWMRRLKGNTSGGISTAASDSVGGHGASFGSGDGGYAHSSNQCSAAKSIFGAPGCRRHLHLSSKSFASASSLNWKDGLRAGQSEPRRPHTPVKDIGLQQPQSRKKSVSKRDEEIFPFEGGGGSSSYVSVNRRKTRIDLRPRLEQNIMRDDGTTSKLDAANCTSQHDRHPADAYSETRGRNSHKREFKSRRQSIMGNPSTTSSGSPLGSNKVLPFDICLPQGRNLVLEDARMSERDRAEEILQTAKELGQVLRPGMVLLKKYIALREQVKIVKICRELGVGPGGFYQPSFPDGARMRLQMMCLGMNWDPITRAYEDQRPFDGSRPPDIPYSFRQLVERAIGDAHELVVEDMPLKNPRHILPTISPNICIVNFYTTSGRLGLHQDRDESRDSLGRGLPVVSLSVGDSAEFLYGDTRDVDEAKTVVLESGDVLIFGGNSRMIYHGISSIYANSAPKALQDEAGFRPGRLNLTFRQF
ncbi:hypothetical protein CDL15_Pgr000524 [Punica granatum]|uniref:Fe2OG dioxygenase domain-containing protein n=1 Tax=Punica granatum TaxID=22663 RepID=A0A218W4N6_PUNGR|nr:hypothetical protein CDL15_Pgr000524 [Punica granatum]